MKKLFIALVMCLTLAPLCAQNVVFEDNFDSNKSGWNEYVFRSHSVMIKEGSLQLMNKDENYTVNAYCDAMFNAEAPFTLSLDILTKKLPDDKYFGFVVDYEDSYNYVAFYIEKDYIKMERVREGKVVARTNAPIDLAKYNLGKIKEIKCRLEYTGSKAKLYINNIPTINMPRISFQSSGIGVLLTGKQSAMFDNLKIEQ